MTALLRALRSISLAVWVGSLVFFIVVAGVAFASLPSPHEAGMVVRGSLLALHRIGFLAGGLYFVLTLTLLATQRDSHPVRAIELALVVAMLSLTAYLQLSVLPRMEDDRLALGGDVQASPKDAPAHKHFDRLHILSTRLEGAVLIEGLILICLAPIHGREDFDRYA